MASQMTLEEPLLQPVQAAEQEKQLTHPGGRIF